MKSTFALVLFALVVGACGGYRTETVQKAEKGFIKFVGDTTAIMISIDEGQQFAPDPKIDQYQVNPGKHAIKVYRANQMIVNRVVLIDNQTTMEIDLP